VSLPTADNWRVARARAAAVLGGSDIELIMIDMQTTKRDDYLAKFPAGCVPAFEATDGTIIQQSGAIATYGECRVVRSSDLVRVVVPHMRSCPPTFSGHHPPYPDFPLGLDRACVFL
jgi:hypothetical protein